MIWANWSCLAFALMLAHGTPVSPPPGHVPSGMSPKLLAGLPMASGGSYCALAWRRTVSVLMPNTLAKNVFTFVLASMFIWFLIVGSIWFVRTSMVPSAAHVTL